MLQAFQNSFLPLKISYRISDCCANNIQEIWCFHTDERAIKFILYLTPISCLLVAAGISLNAKFKFWEAVESAVTDPVCLACTPAVTTGSASQYWNCRAAPGPALLQHPREDCSVPVGRFCSWRCGRAPGTPGEAVILWWGVRLWASGSIALGPA